MRAGVVLPTRNEQYQGHKKEYGLVGCPKLALPKSEYTWSNGGWGLSDRLANTKLMHALERGRESPHWSLYGKNWGGMFGTLALTQSLGNSGYVTMNEDGGTTLCKNVDPADNIVRLILSHDVIHSMPAPKVTVMGKIPSEGPHRAYAHTDHIVVDQADEVEVIVHEIGHYIENHVPQLWWELLALREARHFWKTHKAVTAAIPESQEPNEEAQGRYAGDYPATEEYTSKIYDCGATEMLSMTLQLLASEKGRERLSGEDPVLMLTVLRRLRPDDEELQGIAKVYAAFLPECASPSIYDPDGC